jgi:hypothetical protein
MLSWLTSCLAMSPQSSVAPAKDGRSLTMAEPYPEIQRPSTLYMNNRKASMIRNSIIPPPPSHNRISKQPLNINNSQ